MKKANVGPSSILIVTQDGIQIDLYANIELPDDTASARQVAAAGVGLYRTEFLFMNRLDVPDEEEHLASYLHVVKGSKFGKLRRKPRRSWWVNSLI